MFYLTRLLKGRGNNIGVTCEKLKGRWNRKKKEKRKIEDTICVKKSRRRERKKEKIKIEDTICIKKSRKKERKKHTK